MMQFVEKFEPVCRLIDGSVVSLGLYDMYDEAQKQAIMQANSKLPEEFVVAYQINKVYLNLPAYAVTVSSHKP